MSIEKSSQISSIGVIQGIRAGSAELDTTGAEIDIGVKALMGSLQCVELNFESWIREVGSCVEIGRRIAKWYRCATVWYGVMCKRGFVLKVSMNKGKNHGGHDAIELLSSEDRQNLIREKASDELWIRLNRLRGESWLKQEIVSGGSSQRGKQLWNRRKEQRLVVYAKASELMKFIIANTIDEITKVANMDYLNQEDMNDMNKKGK
ncbi:hypothetical protein BDK51DRAFT_34250 [Blyttiomyces helicus]|uniref:Uncharacterized protein n=1 Tax=Blyttiomyces helicus TaxID=388810 RepID=A0A4P9W7W1_9FUNG|nr:hypothetical protein BDK51DRAFT_34250 [Blyttiomyces helicus]|eukprot:RKO87138.1 hypothetical protein BDK51DRAFT_34250 [Blyttiomyces helicus]